MKTIVITGSTRGIGLGLAREFLRRGHQVVVSGRGRESANAAALGLSAAFDERRILGQPCDVTDAAQARALWDAAVARFGAVDIWINNAGLSNPRGPLWEIPFGSIDSVVRTNVLGAMYGSRVAMLGMLKQGHGQIYNMEGLGSNGMVTPGLTPYAATKVALTTLTKGLVKEAAPTPVQVCYLSPGMVVTELLTAGYSPAELERTKRIFNILADRVETVTPYLVERILANKRNGARIAWLTRPKIAWRFATASFHKRDVFATA